MGRLKFAGWQLAYSAVYSDSNSPMHLLDAAGFGLQREVRNFDVSSKSCRSVGEIYTLDYMSLIVVTIIHRTVHRTKKIHSVILIILPLPVATEHVHE